MSSNASGFSKKSYFRFTQHYGSTFTIRVFASYLGARYTLLTVLLTYNRIINSLSKLVFTNPFFFRMSDTSPGNSFVTLV